MAHLLGLRRNGRYLDLACGTGNYTVSLATRGGLWTGVDAAVTMIEQAQAKSSAVHWELGEAQRIAAADGTYDGVLCSLALHHLHDLDGAIREVRRVLRGGRFVMFTSNPEQMRRYWLNAYFPVAMARSIEQMPDTGTVEEACLRTGFRQVTFEPYFVQPDLQDGFLYFAKHRPELYLTEQGRGGSSTFRILADPEEIRTGCEMLASDLRTGRFSEVFARYDSELGDYLFLVAAT
jgi:SAM-dependent methyltransferase